MKQILTHPIFIFLFLIVIAVSAWLYKEEQKKQQLIVVEKTTIYREFIGVNFPKAALLCGDKHQGYGVCTQKQGDKQGALSKAGSMLSKDSKWSSVSNGNQLTVSYPVESSSLAQAIVSSFSQGDLNRISRIKAVNKTVVATLLMPVLDWADKRIPLTEQTLPLIVDLSPGMEVVVREPIRYKAEAVIMPKYIPDVKPQIIIIRDDKLDQERQVRIQDRAERINADRENRRDNKY